MDLRPSCAQFAQNGDILTTFLGRPRNNQRGTCFVNQDVVNFVYNRIVEWALYQLGLFDDHVVTQVVEAEFAVGAIGNICVVGLAAGDWTPVNQAPIVAGCIGVNIIGVKIAEKSWAMTATRNPSKW